MPQRDDAELMAFVDWAVKNGASAARPSDTPAKFSVGDRVTVHRRRPARPHPQGPLRARQDRHHRDGARHDDLPGQRGQRRPRGPQHVYTVKFTNEELWGAEAAEPNGVVYFDVWEPYIVPAAEQRHDRPHQDPGGDRRPRQGARGHHDREGDHDDRRDRPARGDLRERGGPATGRRGRRQGLDRPGVQGPAGRQRHRGLRRAGHRWAAGRGHGRRREHPHRAQRDHVHAVLLLSVAGAGIAAELVQGPRVPRADRARAAEGAARGLRSRRAGHGRGARVGLVVRDALLGAPAAARRHGRARREGARRARHARLHDRHRRAKAA